MKLKSIKFLVIGLIIIAISGCATKTQTASFSNVEIDRVAGAMLGDVKSK